MANLDEHNSDFLWRMSQDKLMQRYEELGELCETHSYICDCEDCVLFLAVGEEIHRRRRAMLVSKSKRNH